MYQKSEKGAKITTLLLNFRAKNSMCNSIKALSLYQRSDNGISVYLFNFHYETIIKTCGNTGNASKVIIRDTLPLSNARTIAHSARALQDMAAYRRAGNLGGMT